MSPPLQKVTVDTSNPKKMVIEILNDIKRPVKKGQKSLEDFLGVSHDAVTDARAEPYMGTPSGTGQAKLESVNLTFPKQADMNLFEDCSVNVPTLYRDRTILENDFLPDQLLCREEQIAQIVDCMKPIFSGGIPQNVIMGGDTGSGKTALAKKVMNDLILRLNEQGAGEDIQFIYVNCMYASSTQAALQEIASYFNSELVVNGRRNSEAVGLLEKYFKNKTTVFIFDEVDRLLNKTSKSLDEANEILYLVTRGFFGKSSAICISNNNHLEEWMSAKVKSSLSPEVIIFPRYEQKELLSILSNRSGLAIADNCRIEEGVEALCVANALSEDADARYAITLFMKACDIAQGKLTADSVPPYEVKINDVYAANKRMQLERLNKPMSNISTQSKMVLYAIALADRAFSYYGAGRPETGGIYDLYRELCKMAEFSVTTQRNVSGLITKLGNSGVITTRVVSNGRYGLTRRIELASSFMQVMPQLAKDEHIRPIIVKYRPIDEAYRQAAADARKAIEELQITVRA